MQSSDPLTLEPEGYTSSLTNMIPVWSGGQEYLSSAASGGIAGSLASLISRMFIAYKYISIPSQYNHKPLQEVFDYGSPACDMSTLDK